MIIFQVLSGLLHLGNIQFSNPVDESQPCELEDKAKGEACHAPGSLVILVQMPNGKDYYALLRDRRRSRSRANQNLSVFLFGTSQFQSTEQTKT